MEPAVWSHMGGVKGGWRMDRLFGEGGEDCKMAVQRARRSRRNSSTRASMSTMKIREGT